MVNFHLGLPKHNSAHIHLYTIHHSISPLALNQFSLLICGSLCVVLMTARDHAQELTVVPGIRTRVTGPCRGMQVSHLLYYLPHPWVLREPGERSVMRHLVEADVTPPFHQSHALDSTGTFPCSGPGNQFSLYKRSGDLNTSSGRSPPLSEAVG